MDPFNRPAPFSEFKPVQATHSAPLLFGGTTSTSAIKQRRITELQARINVAKSELRQLEAELLALSNAEVPSYLPFYPVHNTFKRGPILKLNQAGGTMSFEDFMAPSY